MSFPRPLRSHRPRAPFLLLALLTLASACGARVGQRPPSASARASLPRGSVVSEIYRIALRPTAGWRLLGPDEAREYTPAAVLAAMPEGAGGAGMGLFVDALGAESLAHVAERLVETVPLERPRVIARERTRVAGNEAALFQVEGLRGTAPLQLGVLAFEHQGYAYKFLFINRTFDDPAVRALLDGIELLPGEVQLEWTGPDTQQATGANWRVRARRFESAASALTVDPGAEWRLIPSESLAQIYSEAEVGLVARSPEMYLALVPTRVLPAQQLHFRRTQLATVAAGLGERTPEQDLTIPFDGRPLSLTGYAKPDMQYLLGMQCEGEVCTRVFVWWPRGPNAAARRLLTESPPTFSRLRADARAALERELHAAPPPSRSAGLDYSLRNGRFVHYPSGTTLRLPAHAGWSMQAATGTSEEEEEAEANPSLFFSHRRLGLSGALQIETLEQPLSEAEYHARTRDTMSLGALAAPATSRQFGRTAGLMSEGEFTEDGLNYRLRLITVVRGTRALRLSVWALPEGFEATRDTVDAVVAGFEVASAPLAQNENVGERWVDARFGWALRVPRVFRYQDRTDATTSAVSRSEAWTLQDSTLVLSTIALPPNATSDTLDRYMEQRPPDLPGLPRGLAAQPVTLAGRPARRLAWQHGGLHHEFIMLQLGHVAYALVTTDREPGGLRSLLESFELLE